MVRRVASLSGQALPPPINFARNSPAACSNIEFASLELQCFWGVSKNDHDKLRAKFGRRLCRCCPWAPRPGPVGQAACLSETVIAFAGAGRASTKTVIAFACSCSCGVETAVAFAGADRASTETAVAFAGEKRAFLVRFSGAEAMVVSMVAVQGRAVVMVVSCLPASVAAEVSLVARSSPVEWCNRFVSFGLGYALSWSGVSSCWVGCGVSRDVVRMSRLR